MHKMWANSINKIGVINKVSIPSLTKQQIVQVHKPIINEQNKIKTLENKNLSLIPLIKASTQQVSNKDKIKGEHLSSIICLLF